LPAIGIKNNRKDRMKDFCKTMFTLFLVSSAFMIGFYLGQEKIVSKIPNFQEESEEIL
jgi:hypothetical protein